MHRMGMVMMTHALSALRLRMIKALMVTIPGWMTSVEEWSLVWIVCLHLSSNE